MPLPTTLATPLTLGELLTRAAVDAPSRVALVRDDASLTWAELDRRVSSVAAGMVRRGVQPGEVLGWLGDKTPELVVSFLACARVGAIFAALNHKLPAARLKETCQQARIRRLIVGPGHRESARRLGDTIDRRGSFYSGPADEGEAHLPAPGTPWDDLLAEAPRAPGHPAGAGDVVYLNFTSGSTGHPKAALTTHAHIHHNAVSTIEALGMTPEDTFLGMFTSFSHPHELFHRTLVLMGTAVLCESWNPRVIGQVVERHQVRWMMAVPSLYEMMRQKASAEGQLRSLRRLEAGGAWVSGPSLEGFERDLGVSFVPVWGSTETTGVALALTPEGARPAGSIGRPCPGYDFSVRGDDGHEVAAGHVGQLWVRGPAVVSGYLGLVADSARRFRDGWYHTGDLVRVDGDGFYHFVGRESEMLKVGGLRVYPLEVELALLEHPAVSQAVVVRIEDQLRGEAPRAIVTLRLGINVELSDLRAHCLKLLPAYKMPRIIEIWPSLPTLPNGKIDRKEVAASRPEGE